MAGGNAFTPSAADTAVLQQVQGQLQILLNEAPLSAGHGHNATAAQELIHTTQTSILNEINGDTNLASALGNAQFTAGNGDTNVGFQSLPAGSDSATALAAATASGASLAQIGNVFNAAADLAVGGLNHSNLSQFNTDMKAVSTGLTNLINNPAQLAAVESGEAPQDAALTTVHLDTMLNQVNLQINDYDQKFGTNHTLATRGTNDNLLDIIDIAQGDQALATAATGNGAQGFAALPSYLTGTITPYQDNQAQTNFWSQFLSEANVINGQLNNVAAGNNATPGELQSLITEVQNYQQFGASFDKSQGGVFGARFDNELLAGTLLADTSNAVQGLKGIANGDTGAALAADQAQIQAAGQGFVADAQDVSGNNIPIGGGTYVGTATTVAGATSVAGVAQGSIPVAGAASGSTGLAIAQNGAGAGTGATGQGNGNAGAGTATGTAGQADASTGVGVAQNGTGAGAGTAAGGQGTGTAAVNAGSAQGAGTAAGTGTSVAQNGTGTGTGSASQGDANTAGDGFTHSHFNDFLQHSAAVQNHFDLLWHHA